MDIFLFLFFTVNWRKSLPRLEAARANIRCRPTVTRRSPDHSPFLSRLRFLDILLAFVRSVSIPFASYSDLDAFHLTLMRSAFRIQKRTGITTLNQVVQDRSEQTAHA